MREILRGLKWYAIGAPATLTGSSTPEGLLALMTWRARRDSNPESSDRSQMLYPLSYGRLVYAQTERLTWMVPLHASLKAGSQR